MSAGRRGGWWLRGCCAALAIMSLGAVAGWAAAPLKVLVLTGSSDLPYHRWQATTASVRGILEENRRCAVAINETPRDLTAEMLVGFDAVVINYHGPRWPAAAESAVEAFVRAGKGLVTFHQGCYGPFFGHEFRDKKWRDGPAGAAWPEYPRMIGATWDLAKLGHARRGIFPVEWQLPEHPVCRGLATSFEANDELYHRLTLAPGVQVLASAMSPKTMGGTGEREPLVWTNAYGKGRVFFTTLGHDALAFDQPGMRALIARGVEWAATGGVAVGLASAR